MENLKAKDLVRVGGAGPKMIIARIEGDIAECVVISSGKKDTFPLAVLVVDKQDYGPRIVKMF